MYRQRSSKMLLIEKDQTREFCFAVTHSAISSRKYGGVKNDKVDESWKNIAVKQYQKINVTELMLNVLITSII